MNERLTPLERIRRKKDFESLYRDGRRFRGRYFNLVYRPSPLDHSRLAVVVSRKVGPAVVRNKVKRRVRDLFRRNKGLLPGPTDIIVVARREIADIGMPELRAGYFLALESIGKKRSSS
jgi:ribonuclease P protein component